MAAEETEVAAAESTASTGTASITKAAGIAVGLFALMLASQVIGPIVACKIVPDSIPNCPEPEPVDPDEPVIDTSQPPIYLAMDPPLVVSFQQQSAIRFLQAKVEIMSRDEDVIERVEQHMPVIRNNLLMLLGGRPIEELTSREGKEKLRMEALAEVRKTLKKVTGESNGPEDLYFTSFVVQ